MSCNDSPKDDRGRFPALIMAAGKSRRMGFPKALMKKDGLPVIVKMVSDLRECGWQPVGIAVSDRDVEKALREFVPDVDHLFNPDPDRGMISTLRIGFEWAGDNAAGLLSWPVDTPMVGRDTLRKIREAADGENVIIPVFQGRRGHPVWWGKASWEALISPEADLGANRAFGRLIGLINEIPVPDEGVLIDLDTPQDAKKYGFGSS
jgi:molybdenum cofactor cytidylyltransferase